MSEKLKACHCGSENVNIYAGEFYSFVKCEECKAQTGYFRLVEDAIEYWNSQVFLSKMLQISVSDFEKKFISRLAFDEMKLRAEKAETEVEGLVKELEKYCWISVNKKLPEMGEIVLVTEGNSVCEGKREFDFFHEFEWVTVDRFMLKGITHWMPKPEPKK